jgi:hypothetical protein
MLLRQLGGGELGSLSSSMEAHFYCYASSTGLLLV